ncbi:MAG: DUF3857 domain-containing protein [Saprospiraceae bacterium]|nr:DUF3857 domain-containing protein [Saprospiraceae bacterium]
MPHAPKNFQKEAYDRANFRIVFNRARNQSITGLKATCYNVENGKLTEIKMTDDNVIVEEIYKDIFVKKVTIPGVREGSIIEIKYTITNPSIQDWTFQDEIPTIWSEYEMQVPDFYIFTKLGQGFTPYALNDESRKSETLMGTSYTYTLLTYHYIQKDVPALKPEKFMSSIEDYRTRLTFHLQEIRPPNGMTQKIMGSWEATSKLLTEDDDFGNFIDKKGALKEELTSIANPAHSALEKVQAIYDYVGKNFEPTEKSFSFYATSGIKELKKKRKVTPAEMNLVFLNMLNSVGIESNPVIVRNREDGRVRTTLAALRRFNHVLSWVKLEKDTFFVDASGYPQPMKLLPFNSLTGYGVAILGKESYQILVPQSKVLTRRFTQANLSLNTEGVLAGSINFTESGYYALNTKKNIKELGAEKYLQNRLKNLIADGKMEGVQFENPENLGDEAPLKGKVNVSTTAYVTQTDDKIFISPMLSFGTEENPFTDEERKFEIDYGNPRDEMYQISLTIPEGYKPEELPKNIRLTMPDGSARLEYSIAVIGNKLSLNSKLSIKKAVFYADEYPFLKELFTTLVAKAGEQIVLTKSTK